MPELDKEEQQLNKNIVKILNILKPYAKSTAQIKAEKEEEAKLLDDKKKLQQDKTETHKRETKEKEQQRVKLFDVTKFIGAETSKYFEKTKEDRLTWEGISKALSTGVKDWFRKAEKQRGFLGMTLRLGSRLWKATHQHLIQNVQRAFSTIVSQVQEVLGPELTAVFSFIKDTFMSGFRFIKDTLFGGLFGKVPPHDRRRNRLLQKIWGYFMRKEKREFLAGLGKKREEGIPWWAKWLLIPMAALAGAIIRKFLLPFEVVWKMSRLGPLIKGFKDFLLSFGKFGKFIFGIKWTFIKWGRAISQQLNKFSGFLHWFGRAFEFGFKALGKWLFWLVAFWDFIWGWTKTAGGVKEKFAAGLSKAIWGMIEVPIDIIGWAIKKVGKVFGLELDDWVKGLKKDLKETTGMTGKFMSAWLTDPEGPYIGFWNALKEMFMEFGNVHKDYIEPILELLDKLKVIKIPGLFVPGLGPKTKQIVPGQPPTGGERFWGRFWKDTKEALGLGEGDTPEARERRLLEELKDYEEFIEKKRGKKLTEEEKKAWLERNRQLAEAINKGQDKSNQTFMGMLGLGGLGGLGAGAGIVDTKQTPDESDHPYIGYWNLNV